MGDYLRGCIQISDVANKKFIEELETGHDLKSGIRVMPYRLKDGNFFQSPYLGFLVKYGRMSEVKEWLIKVSTKHASWIMVTMTYEDQWFDAFTNIPGLDPHGAMGWGYEATSDRETNDRAELRKSLEIKLL